MITKFKNPLFLDSGAHGLYNEHILRKGHKFGYDWYKTKEFWAYLDTYADFVKKNKVKYYASVDVIFNPEMTWVSQEYMEAVHDLRPIPTIHFGTPKKWLIKYLEKGYDYIALGGLGQEAQQSYYVAWADNMFEIICDQPSNLPLVKVHGFAMTSYHLMSRYPWYSVDSTTWLSLAMYGQLIVPPNVKGEWKYDRPFHIIRVSDTASKAKRQASQKIKKFVNKYIEEKGFSLGKSKQVKGEPFIIKPGVTNSTDIRSTLNAVYFLDFCQNTPQWPWAFKNQRKLL